MINKKLKNGSLIYVCEINKLLKIYDSRGGIGGTVIDLINQ